ncbi:MAG: TonB-dependent receptor [Bacteroidetes bacterium]|nr:TonB-dependent receptor [Bacteroidota bacterium]MBU1116443.1 TonB-dependent receptor [Bacteroidota bacterium]MBU1800022.1 TonB-dependent receptor [Bacteroidota bacterium]
MTRKFSTILFKIFLLILFVGQSNVFGQSGKVRGNIIDAVTNDPLPYVNIQLVGTSIGAAANEDGEFLIVNVPPGKYTLRASYIGYKKIEKEIEVFPTRTIEYEFEMQPESLTGETVVVTSQAEGQRQAINEQINSIAIKSVVSAARIQELPDANAAESVGRLPGVSIMRTGGEGSKVVIRGLSPQYNRVTIDGVELPSNATTTDPNAHTLDYGSSSSSLSVSGDRASDLSMISSNMLGGIEVIKAITPDMDATAIGGVVNFSMRKATKTESSKPLFEILMQGSNNTLKDTYKDFKLVGSYEQRYWDNSFGIFAQANYEEKNLSANELSGNYYFDGTLNLTDEGDPEFKTMNLTDVFRNRDRYGATVIFDYLHETGSIGFMNFYSKSKTNEQRRSEDYNLRNDDLFYFGNYSDNDLTVYSNLLSIKQTLGDWGMDLKLSHSYSVSETPNDVKFSFWQDQAGFEDLLPTLKYATTKEIAERVVHAPENAAFFDIYDVENISKDRTYGAALDLFSDYTLSHYLSAKVKFGGSFQYRTRSYDYNQRSGSVFYDDGGQVNAAVIRAFPQFGSSVTFSDFIDTDYKYGEFLNGDYTLGDPMNIDLMMDVIEVAKKNPGTGNGGGYKLRKAPSLINDYSGNEARSAGYAMVNFNFGQVFTFIPGGRYQNLTSEYTGIRGEEVPGGLQSIEVTKIVSHGYFLPMLHFRVKPNDWLQIHFAYTNTLNYPDYNTIIPSYYIGTNFIRYNNYELKPATSENFDLICSIYSNELGLFSVGGFKKNIKDLIFPIHTYPEDWSIYPEVYEVIKNRPEKYSLVSYKNNPIKIDVYGIETEWQTNFWYLPDPLSGLVLNVNYTHIFSEAEYPRTYFVSKLDSNYILRTTTVDTTYSSRLLNQPNDILNVSLGYDYAGFSIRVSMLYKDNIFKNPDFWLQNRVNSDEYLRFDLSAKQELPWYGIQVYLNINNLTSEDDIDINQKTSYITNQQRYGMSADLGVRVKF